MIPRPTPIPPRVGQESVWAFPRPARAEPVTAHLRVEVAGRTVAETRAGFRAIETSHPPSYYFPPGDVDMACLVAADTRSLCEWKGGARYYDLVVGAVRRASAAWAYPDPTDDFSAIRDYIAFYPGRVDACLVDGERVIPQEGGFYGGWITSRVAGPFKGPRGTEGW